MNIKPLANRVVITIEKAENKTASGLILPENTNEPPRFGTVSAVGPDVTTLAVGNRVFFNEYQSIVVPDTDSRIISEKEVYAIVED